MNNKTFYPGLLLISLICICISYWCIYAKSSNSFLWMIGIIAFFLIFTAALYFVASKTVRSKNLYHFTRIFLVSVFVKMFLFIGLVAIMVKLFLLEPKPLVIPLISTYVFFTVYETYYLMRLSKA